MTNAIEHFFAMRASSMHGPIPLRLTPAAYTLLMHAASAIPIPGIVYKGVVKAVMPYGAFCSLENCSGKDGLIHVSQLDPAGGRVQAAANMVAVGDRLSVRVLAVEEGKVSLTCRDVYQGEEAPEAMRPSKVEQVLGQPPTAEELEQLPCVTLSYARSSGAGGQNVNKLSTKCEARLFVEQSPWAGGVKARLLSGSSATSAGAVLVTSERHRTQSANRQDALEKLAVLVSDAWRPPKVRRQYTGLSEQGKRQRRDDKRRTAEKKENRRLGSGD